MTNWVQREEAWEDEDNLPRRKPWVAGLLSLFFGPVGQLYCGRLGRAAVWFFTMLLLTIVSYAAFVYVANGLVSVVLCLLIVAIPRVAMIIDAVVLARRSTEARRKFYQRWWVYVLAIVLLECSGAFLIGPSIVQQSHAFVMPTRSMRPTIEPGDCFLVDRLIRRFREPRRGEIVAQLANDQSGQVYAKRVIGLPGDAIEIRDEHVFRNGEALDEPYACFDGPMPPLESFRNLGPHEVPAGHIFLLGDMRRNSKDSRYDGDYLLDDAIGVARIVYWSREYQMADPVLQQPETQGNIRWNRIGIRLD